MTRRTLMLGLAACLSAGLSAGLCTSQAAAHPAVAGRWQAQALLGGVAQTIVLDLAPLAQGWAGSYTLPGRGVKGAVTRQLQVDAQGRLTFEMPAFAAASASLAWQGDGALVGELRQGGHSTTLRMLRTGAAQVDLPPASTRISAELEGVWTGGYELGGYPRQVTLTLRNRDGVGQAELLIVGRQRNVVAVDAGRALSQHRLQRRRARL
jgi:hypothetical protein